MNKNNFDIAEIKRKELLTRNEAAFYLGVCLTVLDRLDIPRYKFRRNVRYKKSDVDFWLNQQGQGERKNAGKKD